MTLGSGVRRRLAVWCGLGLGLAVAAVSAVSAAPAKPQPAGAATGGLPRAEVRRQAEELTALGRAMFVDPSLSASGKLSCGSCHDPRQGFGPPNALPVQMGGGDMTRPGV